MWGRLCGPSEDLVVSLEKRNPTRRYVGMFMLLGLTVLCKTGMTGEGGLMSFLRRESSFSSLENLDGLAGLESNMDFDEFRPVGRRLELKAKESTTVVAPLWQTIYMCCVLLYMFVALLSDRIGADWVMMTALTLCMAANIITVSEGLVGFANEGIITVLVLFVVAAGISHTGALDWYMGQMLGRPTKVADAQVRLMLPIAIISAFLNNTPVVVVMIPIVLRWGKNVGINPQKLLIPLSFASILGGTCTLIGTSTNLVVYGLLQTRYPDDPIPITLFSLGEYGVPIAFAGGAYLLLVSSCLLPPPTASCFGNNSDSNNGPPISLDGEDYVLMGARLTKWSTAAGRSVKRSGLRDTGGLYLVSVHRAATGNVHRAVGQDFVLNVGDVLYFTGLVDGFGDFCEEHGLEMITNEVEDDLRTSSRLERRRVPYGKSQTMSDSVKTAKKDNLSDEDPTGAETMEEGSAIVSTQASMPLSTVASSEEDVTQAKLEEIGLTKESLTMATSATRLVAVNRMTDFIRGISPSEPCSTELSTAPSSDQLFSGQGFKCGAGPPQIIVASDRSQMDPPMVIIAVNALDRPGLLHDISKGLLGLNLQCHHTEATVRGLRAISVWRCEILENGMSDPEAIWTLLSELLHNEGGIEAIKHRGLRVIRAVVRRDSRLIGKTAGEADFRQTYQAAIVAVQRGGKNLTQSMSKVRFEVGDLLILQAREGSHLLEQPEDDFYSTKKSSHPNSSGAHQQALTTVQNLVKRVKKTFSHGDLVSMGRDMTPPRTPPPEPEQPIPVDQQRQPPLDIEISEDQFGIGLNDGNAIDEEVGLQDTDSLSEGSQNGALSPEDKAAREAVWKDLQVAFPSADEEGSHSKVEREFLTAMEVAPNSGIANKTASQNGLTKLPGVFLVSIERPIHHERNEIISISSDVNSLETMPQAVETVSPDRELKEGDILWFSGSAAAVGDLRKIPGLQSYESDEVNKINDKVHDRRLVQAVVSRKGPLVGNTVAGVQFRTRYGAAVIAVHREGRRVHEHPGRVKLQAGDVLLLEAGPTFVKKNAENDRSFALLSEVENSAPPRLRLFVPALVITVAMLAVTTFGVTSLLIAALVASILMVILGMLTQQEARDAIHWDVFITIAAAFGIGTALVNSGVASGIANFLVKVGTGIGIGVAGLFGAVYLATFLISNVVTNNAAAALIFPIAMEAAERTETDLVLMSYCIMLGASASFMSPFGYTTNLLIYGPGGYKTMDFIKIGTPMQFVLWILTTALLSVKNLPWYVSWIATMAIFVVVAIVGIVDCSLFRKNNKKD